VTDTLARKRAASTDLRLSTRRDNFDCLAALWKFSTLDRVRLCRRRGSLPGGAASLRALGAGSERRAGLGNVQTCASVWACPCCTERIAAVRQDELDRALTAWTARGGSVAMVTLTMKHHRGQSLADLWDALSKAWGRVTSGRRWEAVHARWGSEVDRVFKTGERAGEIVTRKRVGWARVVETTHGENGWHVHIHAALFLAGGVDAKEVDDLGVEMFYTWRKALLAAGLAAPSARNGGLDARLWDGARSSMANYFTKARYRSTTRSLAAEITRSDRKQAKAGHRNPWQLLADLVTSPTRADYALWAEWEQASLGRRQLTWATGFRDQLLAEAELSNEEIVEQSEGGDDVVVLPGETVRYIVNHRLWPTLLDLVESDDDGTAVRHYLSALDLEFFDPDDYWRAPDEEGSVDHLLSRDDL
jgi:hypothetical protein